MLDYVKALKAFGGGVKSLGCPEPNDATFEIKNNKNRRPVTSKSMLAC